MPMPGLSLIAPPGQYNAYKYSAKELQRELELNWGDHGARMMDFTTRRWRIPDPLSEERYHISPYAYASNNPINRVDPTGMLDGWYEDELQKMVFDASINSQQDLTDAGIKGNYLGNSGTGVDEETGDMIRYNADGTTDPAAYRLPGATVTGKMSRHAQIMSNPTVRNIHQAQEDFWDHPVTQATVGTLTFVATGGIEGVISLASSGAKLLPNVKSLKSRGGNVNGITISKGGYGAKPRFDIHPLGGPSKASNSMPSWTQGKTLPHYHRGAGNNLHRHRPWEKGWNDSSFWNRF
jgi:RHS repeat-associated protein